jgi:ABC-type glycerol-3-phosphate transport system substrate-binding protein
MGRLRVLLAGAAFGLLGCSGDRVLGDYPPSTCDLAKPPEEFSDEPFSIATFWADREQAALETLRKRVDSDRYLISTEQIGTRVEVQRHINDAFESQKLPDVFQVNGGSDVLRWVRDREPELTDVCPLDRLRDHYHWSKRYFPEALGPLSCNGNLYGLPVGIHHLNVLFYNRELWDALAQRSSESGARLLAPAQLKSPYDLVAQLRQIAALNATTPAGKPLAPLALGTESEWPLTIVAFENVLLSLSRDAYETLWMGGLEGAIEERHAALRATLQEMLALLRDLRSFSDTKANVSWQDALRRVGAGEALLTITGDWGFAQLDPEMLAKVETITFPGTADTFVYTPDSFAVPRELKKNGFPARSFLESVVADKAALIDFSNAKHSIPPRNDLTDTEVSLLASESLRETYRQFVDCTSSQSCKLLLAVSGLAPPPGTDPCFDEMDSLLGFAVTGRDPFDDSSVPRRCASELPRTGAEAEARLLDLLLQVAQRRFAADCR